MKLSYLLFGEDRTASKTLRKVGDEAGHTGSRLEGMGSRASGALAAVTVRCPILRPLLALSLPYKCKCTPGSASTLAQGGE